jgi:hypothetical protein
VGLECDWASRELAVDGRADVPLRHLTSTTSIHGRGGWAERAADLGWDTLAPFGCHPTRPLDHLNGAGLLWRISGGKITGMQSDWATIEIDGGWAERAADLGRDTLALFGCHATRSLDHLNGAGLLSPAARSPPCRRRSRSTAWSTSSIGDPRRPTSCCRGDDGLRERYCSQKENAHSFLLNRFGILLT